MKWITFSLSLLFILSPLNSFGQRNSLDKSLFYAARGGNITAVKQLLARGANINSFTYDRETPLHAAASTGRIHVVKLLLRKGAIPNPKTRSAWIPLHHAVRFGHVATVNYLLSKGAPLYQKTGHGQTVFDITEVTKNKYMMHVLNGWRR
ncbi:MAG: ankyrin repeat domain-containing protein [Thiotrichaceae bacterium]|nr:ankyrin repeat domain-containing protein [Thiotrichaceae bacterium]